MTHIKNNSKLIKEITFFKIILTVIIFYVVFAIIYLSLKDPGMKPNHMIINITMFIYIYTIFSMSFEIFSKLKANKKEIMLLLLLLLYVFVLKIILLGVPPFRDTIFIQNAIDAQNGDFSKGAPHFIRHFGNKVMIKLSGLLLGRISWRNFTIISHIIAFLGLITTYFVSKRINKKSVLSLLSITIILSSSFVLFFLGSEEFSSFAVSFLMIAYYFMLERKPLNALIAFMAAAFSRTEVFLLFPFFIAQYWYVNSINFKIKKEFKKIKKLPLKKIIPSTILVIILCIEFWFLATNLAELYSYTSRLELFGPQPKRDKEIFTYLYYHLTYNLTSRIISNVSFIITQTFFQGEFVLGSTAIFALFTISSLVGLKDRKIHIFLFNILFFFVLYAVIRYEGFIKEYCRYTLFITYPVGIITPHLFIKNALQKKRKRPSGEKRELSFIVILILIFLIFIPLLSPPEHFKTSSQLIYMHCNTTNFYKNLSKDCKFIYLTNFQPLLFIRIPDKSEILPLQMNDDKFKAELSKAKKENKCIYFITPLFNDAFYIRQKIEYPSQKSEDLPNKIKGLIKLLIQEGFIKIYNFTTENICQEYSMCEQKVREHAIIPSSLNLTRILTQLNQTGMKSELSGIYYWQSPEYKNNIN